MRKKSHISLAKYLMESMQTKELEQHRKQFYFGSILPDCIPSFITKRHNIEETFEILKKEIVKVTEEFDVNKGMNGYYCRHLGVITHYISDYFIFPHNNIFEGNIKDHCVYERDLKFEFRQYVNSEESKRDRADKIAFKTVDDICNFIESMHKEYLNAIKEVKIDCHYIVELCHKVVDAILNFFETMMESSVRRKFVFE